MTKASTFDAATSLPPVKDCSVPAPSDAAPAESVTKKRAAAACAEPTCDALTAEARPSRTAFFAPAQSPACDDADPTPTLKITPTELGLTTRRPLTGKQRRRRQRALAAK